ncbi:KTI12 (YKL110C) [Zygosaccharomyces parabailii]|uniref:ZYBA0S03-07272g1_1 n=1 Tax=Zygosaccharomyces bailii (strain CLIB 213 / ATCC 58445 / CBS 680 / BCRC 21525 / NBRC 1098 / NCYC 1416 / NRRL Y-2227) TaxID=1333698 RepID=A0A8J2T6Q8_ZYGB2|nr:KTI12 (YKL110C) [Zygosaccharomyces parabailii]CDF89017.1 ZYBA0S03-07272g1_1 [Zygosaccharomyces bailii CLIB 213]CDH16102.1 probable protein KTI12 [Zygosaccharomyces bailii ISA1307]SJM83178.1 probable protein KTI12 [Zygosaccharomyces bailii]
MPLVLFTGYPCSGKSTMAQELVRLLQRRIQEDEALAARNYKVVLHSDESLGITHSEYATSQGERKLRSEIFSAVRRDLSKSTIVVVDSLNYIKGFRYQLHCEVKGSATTYCLVHAMCPLETIREWNSAREDPWDPQLLEQLIQRYEEPNGSNRWDSPLFPVLSTQDRIESCIDDVCSALFRTAGSSGSSDHRDPLSKALQSPNSSTVLKPASQSNFIQVLDSQTSAVVRKIMDHVRLAVSVGGGAGGGGARVIVSDSVTDVNDDRCCYVDLPPQGVTLPHLQRLKRQFINFNKLRDLDEDRIVPLFAEYLEKNLND